VLTMERFEGTSISDKAALESSGSNLDEIAKRGANVFIKMIFRDGFSMQILILETLWC
jgi:ubiquinone biosynthesis protein